MQKIRYSSKRPLVIGEFKIRFTAFIHRDIKKALFEWDIKRVILLITTATVALEIFKFSCFLFFFYFLIFTKNTEVQMTRYNQDNDCNIFFFIRF